MSQLILEHYFGNLEQSPLCLNLHSFFKEKSISTLIKSKKPKRKRRQRIYVIRKAKKKKDENEEPEYITPPPVEVTQESGRQFITEIGKYNEAKEWVGFPLIQGSPKKKMVVHKELSKDGNFTLSNLKWEDRESFHAGQYVIRVIDSTECVDPVDKIEIPIMIISQEEEKEVKKEAKAKLPKM